MKSNVLFILAGILILASGCARKCPPCPIDTMGASGSYSGNSSFAPASTAPASSSNYNSSEPSSQYGAASTAKYVSK